MSTITAPSYALNEDTTRLLQTALEQLLNGNLQLWQLPTAITDIFNIGWTLGNTEAKEAAKTEAARYEHELDRLYNAAFGPNPQRIAEIEARLIANFNAEEDRRLDSRPAEQLRAIAA